MGFKDFEGLSIHPATPDLIKAAVMNGRCVKRTPEWAAYQYQDKIVIVDQEDPSVGLQMDTDLINHTEPTEDQPVAVWGNINSLSISACAPRDYNPKQIIDAVQAIAPAAENHKWRLIDIASVRRGSSTPSLCPHAAGRLHWFLVAHPIAQHQEKFSGRRSRSFRT